MKRRIFCIAAAIAALVMTMCLSASALNPWTDTTETVTYDRIEEEKYVINDGNFPFYDVWEASYPNSCAPVAGATILSYYDRYNPTLIGDAQGALREDGLYNYITGITTTIDALYSFMSTNITGPGTTSLGFRRGLSKYASVRGFLMSYIDVCYDGEFWLDDYQTQVEAGRPIALFLTKQNTVSFRDENNVRTIYKRTRDDGNHVMVGFGYCITRYYRNNQNFRTDIYLRAATGYGTQFYLLMDSTLQVDYAAAAKLQKN